MSYPVPYEVKTFVWCARIPPRCPKIRTAMKTGYRDEVKMINQTIKVCCEGFAELDGKCLRKSSFVVSVTEIITIFTNSTF